MVDETLEYARSRWPWLEWRMERDNDNDCGPMWSGKSGILKSALVILSGYDWTASICCDGFDGRSKDFDSCLHGYRCEPWKLREFSDSMADLFWFIHSAYMRSDEWRKVRNRAFRQDGFACVKCGAEFGIQAHHLTYERFGREHPDDLMTLCRGCHMKAHQR